MKKNDLIYSVSLSLLFFFLAGIYFYLYYIKNGNKSVKNEQSVEISPTFKQNDYDPSLVDTLSDFTIKEQEIWTSLHPNGKFTTNEHGGFSKKVIVRIMNNVNPSSNYFHTSVHRVFYYKNLGKQKVFVVLVSYPFDKDVGYKHKYHACSPNYDIANFVYENGTWQLDNHIINWVGAMGAWGEPVQLEFGISELGYTLEMENCFCQGGSCECYNVLYDIPSLKVIKEKEYTTNDNQVVSPENDYSDSVEVVEPTLVDSLE
ncbi:hypothetical protein [Pedobacter immunditicola]|uniref:hypothetical protein n=1 Tax=Pedobacter immunditicola TaxID=3133440 RepID=UPI0030ACAB2D